MEERQYDLIFICRPDTPEADVDKVIATLESTAAEKGAKVESVAKWGRKRMAYRVQKLHEGYFVYMVLKYHARRSGEGARAPVEGGGSGDQVPHRAARRRIEAAGEIEAAPRASRCASPAQGGACAGGSGCANRATD